MDWPGQGRLVPAALCQMPAIDAAPKPWNRLIADYLGSVIPIAEMREYSRGQFLKFRLVIYGRCPAIGVGGASDKEIVIRARAPQ